MELTRVGSHSTASGQEHPSCPQHHGNSETALVTFGDLSAALGNEGSRDDAFINSMLYIPSLSSFTDGAIRHVDKNEPLQQFLGCKTLEQLGYNYPDNSYA